MKEVDILLLYEGKERELESVCLLEVELRKRGYTTEIVCVYPNRERIPFQYKARVVFTPWAYNENDMKYLSCFYMSRNVKIINLHHEQYSGQDGNNVLVPKDTARNIYHISWGPVFTNDLIKVGCSPGKICEAGNIRLDLLKNRFENMAVNKDELSGRFGIDKNKKWVMFIANGYHLANEKKLQNMETIDVNARKKAEICAEIRSDLLNFIDRYLDNNDDAVFIYRPHPVLAELELNTDEIMHLCKKHSGRFFCIFKYAIREWIFSCDISMSIHSTSGIESYFAMRPFYLFRTKNFPHDCDYSFYEDYTNIIEDYSAFADAIKHPNAVKEWRKIENYYVVGENSYAYETIGDYVDKIIYADDASEPRIKYLIYTYIRSLIKRLLISGLKSKLNKKVILKKVSVDNRYKTILPTCHDLASTDEIESIERAIHSCVE